MTECKKVFMRDNQGCDVSVSPVGLQSPCNHVFLLLFSTLILLTVLQAVSNNPAGASEITSNDSGSINETESDNTRTSSLNDTNATSFPVIHAHMSGEGGIFANAYLIETANGVVAIDSTLTVNESKALRASLDSLKKPLLAVLLTHPHPDHVAGVTNLVTSKEVPIIAVESVEKIMNVTEEAKRIQWTPVFKEQWISKWTYPNQNVKDRDNITFDGLTYRVYDLGPGGDSDANSIWILENEPRVAFVGDLIFNGVHSYIADDHMADWLNNIEKVRGLISNVSKIYPGHGQPGSADLLDAQKKYLLAYSEAVRELSNGQPTLTEDAKKELTAKMEQFLPGAGLSFLIANSADPVAAELAKRPN
jgi:glyoxylase-like metal-dependent hydrolase (beta-lactamase superfamily II)